MIRQKNRQIYLILGVILILLIFLNSLGFLSLIKSKLRLIFIPIFTVTNNLSIKLDDNYEFFKDKNTFFESYKECRFELQNSSVLKAEYKILEDENKILKQIIGFKEKTHYTPLIARVIGKNTENMEQTILINMGIKDGVKIGQPVVAGDGIIIGKIVKSELEFSIVRLLNDSKSKIAATVLNGEHSLGVVEGGYGLSIKMNFIPRNEIVLIGELIVTSGLEDNIPKGLLIGSITAIENETYRPFQAAILVPGTELSKLSLVAILIEE